LPALLGAHPILHVSRIRVTVKIRSVLLIEKHIYTLEAVFISFHVKITLHELQASPATKH
jgi:hypothetical protein